MSRPARTPLRPTLLRRSLAALSGGALAAVTLAALSTTDADVVPAAATTARAANVVTPGDFTGYGFDQCHTPDQTAMNAWRRSSPFWAVGVYMSGASRACRDQPNLTPQWVSTQLRKGWRILPITLGPQASCQPRFPRYGNDETIIPKPGDNDRYGKARKQGRAEATKSVAAAQGLGIVGGSTLWYDLEGFEVSNIRCRESALAFLSGWSAQIRELGYMSGVYSSAGSGIKMLDDARHDDRPGIALPDQIWVARWDGQANTDTEAQYLRPDGWRPHARVKQYQGGHNETWGGVTINIDRNFLDLGTGSVAVPETHCGGVKIAFGMYQTLKPGTGNDAPSEGKVKVVQCLLQEQGFYRGNISGIYNARTQAAVQAWQTKKEFPVSTTWNKRNWVSLLVAGDRPVIKFGSVGPAVRRVQRALNAVVDRATPLRASGVFDTPTTVALKTYQDRVGLDPNGVVAAPTWKALADGQRR